MSKNLMALTRRFKQTIAERAQRDPAFVQALLEKPPPSRDCTGDPA